MKPDIPKGLHAADMEVITDAAEGRGVRLTPEMLKDLTASATAVATTAHAWAKTNLSTEQARRIKHWRVDEGFTWRAIAATAYCEFDGDWHPDSNQLWGMELCTAAAELLGENPNEDPWN